MSITCHAIIRNPDRVALLVVNESGPYLSLFFVFFRTGIGHEAKAECIYWTLYIVFSMLWIGNTMKRVNFHHFHLYSSGSLFIFIKWNANSTLHGVDCHFNDVPCLRYARCMCHCVLPFEFLFSFYLFWRVIFLLMRAVHCATFESTEKIARLRFLFRVNQFSLFPFESQEWMWNLSSSPMNT